MRSSPFAFQLIFISMSRRNWDDAVKEFEEVTESWVNGDDQALKDRNDRLRKLIVIRNLDLDPFVRGQTVYSRTGTNVGDGTVTWKYDDGEESFGKSMDEFRKELGIPGSGFPPVLPFFSYAETMDRMPEERPRRWTCRRRSARSRER